MNGISCVVMMKMVSDPIFRTHFSTAGSARN